MRSVSHLTLVILLSLLVGCAPEGSSAYVSLNVQKDDDCTPGDGSIGISTGVWDVGAQGSKADCVHSYFMNLFINSNLKANANDSTGRAEPNVLLITHADVRLMDKNQATLNFEDDDHPNPYRVQTATSLEPTTSTTASTGVVEIEAIPKVYSTKLTGIAQDNDSILLEVQVFGTTTGDVDVDFRPFLFPLSLCRGCLSRCRGAMTDKDIASLTANECVDNAAQDGRWCIDPSC